jgi:Protein of unknown function (DUF2887)
MSTDKQIHLLFKAHPQFLFELADLPYPGPCKVQSIEVKALARTADTVFTPRDVTLPIVIAEIQAQKEKTVYNRITINVPSRGSFCLVANLLTRRHNLGRPWSKLSIWTKPITRQG